MPERGSISAADLAFVYSGGTVLEVAKNAIGQSVEVEHKETWIIANGKYVLWANRIVFSVKGPQALGEAGAEKLHGLVAKAGCLVLTDSKGAKLPLPSKVTRTKSRLIFEWDPIAITDKSRSPKTLHLPWGQITLLDRIDLKIPSALVTSSSC